MSKTSVPYLSADLFCTLDEVAAEGGVKGRLAYLVRRWLTPAGKLMFGDYHMLDIDIRGRDVQEEYDSD